MSSPSSKAWFLGPKAENETSFEHLLLESLRDYCYWRRNFHPEDMPYVSVKDRLDPGFQEYTANLHQHLFEMLSHLKRSTPSFSPRYLGHMMTDLLMPGLLGTFSAMLYNQNNITEEAATITLQFEEEAMSLLAQMLGLPTKSAWGHLCSGGTLANIEALWVARNLQFLPWQVALCAQQMSANTWSHLPGHAGLGLRETLRLKQIQAMSIAEILELQIAISGLAQKDEEWHHRFESCSPAYLGLVDFSSTCREQLGYFPRFLILLSRNAHYSLSKGIDLLGLGKQNSIALPLNSHMQLDLQALESAIQQAHQAGDKILAVVGVYGSTEEGAIDDFEAIQSLREQSRESDQGDFWLHADACYGGYALSMLHPHHSDSKLTYFFEQLWQQARPGEALPENLVWNSQRTHHWLKVSKAISHADSVSIDPHKLGYIPYPAGAILYGNYRVREFIRCDAPYINAVSDTQAGEHWRTPYLGRYTVEGSRPGTTGAALWLAHKTVPLNRSGHGEIIGQSILGARYLQYCLESADVLNQAEHDIQCRFLCPDPDLNILCYTFATKLKGKPVSLRVLNRSLEKLYRNFLATENHPTHTLQFIVAMTRMEESVYGTQELNRILKQLNLTQGRILCAQQLNKTGNPWRDDTHLALLRTVVMGPFLLEAKTRPRLKGQPQDLITQFVELLYQSLPDLILEVMNETLAPERKPHLNHKLLILDKHLDTIVALKEQIEHLSFQPVQAGLVYTAQSFESAQKLIEEHQIPCVLMGIEASEQESQALTLLQTSLDQTYFKGALIFSEQSHLLEHWSEQFPIKAGQKVFYQTKVSRMAENFQATANQMMEDLWEILRDPQSA